MANEVRHCGDDFAYCDGDCNKCYKNHKTYTKDAEVEDDGN